MKFLCQENNRGRFEDLYKIYKYVAILPTTQVKCERDFSTLKITKNRIRSVLSSKKLKYLMIISLCSDIFEDINLDHIVDEICVSSSWASSLF